MIDIGVNLSSSQFRGELAEILSHMRQAGLTHVIATGTSVEATEHVVALSEQHSDVWATAGVHPHKASTWSPASRARVARAAKHPKVVAMGECGLDYNRMFSPREDQLRAFEDQLHLAVELKKPVFLHCRDAFPDFRAMLARFPGLRGVVHCFTAGVSEAQAYLDLGLDIGVTGWVCDMRRGTSLREAVQRVPLDRLHLETDAPYLLPANMPGAQRRGRNVPANLPWVAKELALLLKMPTKDVVEACTANSRRLFGLP